MRWSEERFWDFLLRPKNSGVVYYCLPSPRTYSGSRKKVFSGKREELGVPRQLKVPLERKGANCRERLSPFVMTDGLVDQAVAGIVIIHTLFIAVDGDRQLAVSARNRSTAGSWKVFVEGEKLGRLQRKTGC